MEQFLKVMSALNDESRVMILCFLSHHGELCVCDLQHSLGMIQSRLSRHLKILKEAGFLHLKRKGTWAYYSLSSTLSPLHCSLLNEILSLNLLLPPIKSSTCKEVRSK
ncbi:ArsR/SmtB family transcription factor [Helicobacter cholecystus]|uniref:ArsR/SmtB family transcription factor n=1 Tax=Helicobacter cholecystus TaxID=45498 RepID=UPI00273856FF|nr:metalloregulator ArsR/SmtB family transcription factor [Helicobacter cholecystus]